MDKQEKINKVVQDSENLLNNLKELKAKVGSYGKAKEKLEETNEKLLKFIEITQNLSNESHRIIKSINDIGSSKIFDSLEKIDDEQQKNSGILKDINNRQEKINKRFIVSVSIIGFMLILQIIGSIWILRSILK